jgi:puromycin-sensitive aminopeptidase
LSSRTGTAEKVQLSLAYNLASMSAPNGNDADYRLPRTVRPSRYELRVATSFDDASFEGDVSIELTVLESTDEILLNAAELDISRAVVSPAGSAEQSPLEVTLDPEKERVSFRSSRQLEAGDYVVSCHFAAPLSDKLRGYYKSTFKDPDGNERAIASTHFEATDARRAFPCFDEPEMKAVFSVTLDVKDGLFAVANGPEIETSDLGEGWRRVRFGDTMKMSTYLVAYAVGPFEATEPVMADGNVPLRVVVPEGKLHLTSFALEAAAHGLSFFHRYFDIAYPAEKLDLVAIPDFAMGAMENLGCITFREQDLLCDPSQSSVPELDRIAEVVAHEIAHMWFGDLVTMKWWNGIWLNEAFATFMSLCAEDDFKPEWNRWVQFGTEKDMALQVDGLHATRAIEFPVRAPDEADAMFDFLTYLKGGNVLRMVEQYLGTERFRDGVRKYLKAHAYSNTETTDLWDSIESVSEGEPVRALLDSWIFQGGHPLVTARLEAGKLVVDAEAFAYLPEAERPAGGPPDAIGKDWLVPIRVEDRPGSLTATLLGPKPHGEPRLELGPFEGLPVVNAGGSGTYRLRYEGELFDQILSNLSLLEPLERFNLVSDAWACTLAGRFSPSDFLALVRRLEGEDDPNVWTTVTAAFDLFDFAAADVAEDELAHLVREVFSPELERLGLQVGEDDSPERQRCRSLFINALGTLGRDEKVRSFAREAFSRSRESEALPASLAQAILNVVAASAAREEADALLEGFRNPSDPLSENRHLIALTRLSTSFADEVLSMSLSEVKAQDGPHLLRIMLRNRRAGPQVWAFLKDHYDELSARLPSHAMPTIVGGAALLVQLDESGRPYLVEDVQAFVNSRDFGGQRRLVDQALERQAINARFVTSIRGEIRDLLTKA